MPVVFGTLILLFLFPILGSGPLYQRSVANVTGNCLKNWWGPLLNLNNFVSNPFEMV